MPLAGMGRAKGEELHSVVERLVVSVAEPSRDHPNQREVESIWIKASPQYYINTSYHPLNIFSPEAYKVVSLLVEFNLNIK